MYACCFAHDAEKVNWAVSGKNLEISETPCASQVTTAPILARKSFARQVEGQWATGSSCVTVKREVY